MVQMNHILSLGFPVHRNDFSYMDWELQSVWRQELDDESDRRRDQQRRQNQIRKSAGLKPKPFENY